MHTSKSLSLLAVALMQGLAAAAPQGGLVPINETTANVGSTTGTGTSTELPDTTLSIIPTGTDTKPTGTDTLPIGTGGVPIGTGGVPIGTGLVPIGTGLVPIGTGGVPIGTGSPPIDTTLPISASGSGTLVDGSTTTLSTLTQTKTVSWTVMVPCTTVAGGVTSYYTTASVHKTYIQDLKTLTIIHACTKCAHATPTPVGPGGPGATIVKPAGATVTPDSPKPGYPGATATPDSPNTVYPGCPGGADCPGSPYSTQTVQGVKTVVPIVSPSGPAGVPTYPAKDNTVIGGAGGAGSCPDISTVTVYNPTTIYATVTVTPGVYVPDGAPGAPGITTTPIAGCKDGNCGGSTVGSGSGGSVGCPDGKCGSGSGMGPGCSNGMCTTVVGCSSGKCTTLTSYYTKTYGGWNGTDATYTAPHKPTGTGNYPIGTTSTTSSKTGAISSDAATTASLGPVTLL